MSIVVIDPGHGGWEKIGGSSPNNATGPTGLLEKDVTLQLGLAVRDALGGTGLDILLTRETDRNLGLAGRAAVAASMKAAAFVSIHLNGWETPDVQGTETLIHEGAGPSSRRLAECVQAAVLPVTGLRDRGVKKQALGVLNPGSHDPGTAACLLEVSFMTQPAEEKRLRDAGYRTRIAQAIARGITTYLVEAGRMPEIMVAGEYEDGYAAEHAPALPERGPVVVPQSLAMTVPFITEPGKAHVPFADIPDGPVHDKERMLRGWRSPEIIIDRDDSIHAVFVELMARRRQAVCKIEASGRDFRGRSGGWSGTGFLAAKGVLLTNHHVVNSPEVAAAAECVFDYEVSDVDYAKRRDALPKPGRRFRLMPERLFITSPFDHGLDYTFVAIDDAAEKEFGCITLERAAFTVEVGERAFVIHHPRGKPKRVSLEDSGILGIDSKILHYTTDTEPGSSGASVFDRNCRLIALHHASQANTGGLRRENGTVPEFVNEGIKIAAIALDLEQRVANPADAGAARRVLAAIEGSDSLSGYFGGLGRRTGTVGVENVVDTYQASDQDIDIGFWNVEHFATRFGQKLDDVAKAIVDLRLDIWALSETSAEATRLLVERIEQRFGQRYEWLPSEPDAGSKQATAVLWNPAAVTGRAAPWPEDIDWMLRQDSREFSLAGRAPEAVHGAVFPRYPARFHFTAAGSRGPESAAPFDFFLVPLHLKAMDEGGLRRRMASRILAFAVERAVRDHGDDADWILGGDMNDELAGGDFKDLLDADFSALGAADERDGAFTYLKRPKSLIDHVFLSPNLKRVAGPDDFFILAKDRTSPIDYLERLSDHRPVLLRLSLPNRGRAVADSEGGMENLDELLRRVYGTRKGAGKKAARLAGADA
ncbi:N-acetylmuramoyl-L-alanine amidase [Skermanella mucosa]|uniref:N-acetylmuramoyl-L-alanine amidase n=1 Tax=Skermanella mucosa TaxID=1789672 RepID=UPI00192B1C24|nr:N-acetylmuramoyl-L-alanine amidase [Skermanella mucosa]UEM21637.1 N-acetylmuramoyl-L-alanine amidase [Skermanella mucosa]